MVDKEDLVQELRQQEGVAENGLILVSGFRNRDIRQTVYGPTRSVPQAEADRLRPIACDLLPELLV